MTKILFICHGNICRSPMAEYMFKDMVLKNNMQSKYMIDSAAVSYEEEGNSIYPPAKEILKRHNIPFGNHRAHRMQKSDYNKYDIIICMDESNIYNIMRIISEDPLNKVHRLLEYTSDNRDISDPWYTGDFERAYQDINEGLKALLEFTNK